MKLFDRNFTDPYNAKNNTFILKLLRLGHQDSVKVVQRSPYKTFSAGNDLERS